MVKVETILEIAEQLDPKLKALETVDTKLRTSRKITVVLKWLSESMVFFQR